MNFNASKPTPEPKKNNNKLIAEIMIVLVLGGIGAVGIFHYVMDIQNDMDTAGIKFAKANNGGLPGSESTQNGLEKKLFDKCQNLQDWYRSLDGFENTNYHCDKYAKGWAGLVK